MTLAAGCIPRTPLPITVAFGDPNSAQYAAIGDSITEQGILRPDGWVNQYLGAQRVADLARDGWTSSQVLNALFVDPEFLDGARGAARITLDVGINDYLQARTRFYAGDCGGDGGQECLAAMVAHFDTVFDATLARLDSAAPCALVVVGDLYSLRYLDPPGSPVGGYMTLMNAHIAASGVAVAHIADAFGDGAGLILPDGIHPNSAGQNVIAQAFAAARPVSRCRAAA